ncbi:hydrocephalus-inducing protein-like isoform X2 [Melospiza georgiana]|uniref:hydrocephalus-inducing protein-like isoform X2 n=1 Tax=Melospiza georgiana TaxID=44398 RepID=UPI0025ACC9C5|nr:hydrocephalus-inducing protein-like isoform X2 [Melospiza georgiana]
MESAASHSLQWGILLFDKSSHYSSLTLQLLPRCFALLHSHFSLPICGLLNSLLALSLLWLQAASIPADTRELWLENLMEGKETGKEKGSGEDHTALLRLPGEKAKLHEDPVLFSDDIFFIEPMVKLINLGDIDAPFTYRPSTANVGFCFKFAPEEDIGAPGGTQTAQISFSATIVWRFEEEFQFSVAGSPMSAILTIKMDK